MEHGGSRLLKSGRGITFHESFELSFGHAEDLPYKDRSFDQITDTHGPFIYVGIGNPRAVNILREYVRVLRSDGTICLSDTGKHGNLTLESLRDSENPLTVLHSENPELQYDFKENRLAQTVRIYNP